MTTGVPSAGATLPGRRGTPRAGRAWLVASVLGTAALLVASLSVGGYDIRLSDLLDDGAARDMFFISRVPRTVALVLAAAAMGVSGTVMQMIARNRFVEPTTTGSAQWSALGVLLVLIVHPEAPTLVKMAVAGGFAFAGTTVFLALLRRVSLRTSVVVPLVGIMLGSLVGAVSTFLAATYELQQSLAAWRSGGFNSVTAGNYEPLYAAGAVVVLTYLVAEWFTIAGLGPDVATNLGLNHTRVVLLGSAAVALATGVTTVVVGFLPFLGLIVPNLVTMTRGDDVRRNLPLVVLLSVALVTACDLVGRTVVFPLEIPVSVVLGAVGATGFVVLVVVRRRSLRG